MLATVSEYAASPDVSEAPSLASSAAEAPFLVSPSDLAPCSGFASSTRPGFAPCGESLSGPSVRAAIIPTPAAKASTTAAAAAYVSILRDIGSCCSLCIMPSGPLLSSPISQLVHSTLSANQRLGERPHGPSEPKVPVNRS